MARGDFIAGHQSKIKKIHLVLAEAEAEAAAAFSAPLLTELVVKS